MVDNTDNTNTTNQYDPSNPLQSIADASPVFFNPSYITPAQRDSLALYAQALQKNAQQMPVKNWLQGVSQVVNSIMGGYLGQIGDQQNRQLANEGAQAQTEAAIAMQNPGAPWAGGDYNLTNTSPNNRVPSGMPYGAGANTPPIGGYINGAGASNTGSPLSVRDMIIQEAQARNEDPNVALQFFQQESSLNPSAKGDHGTSFGVPQLHYTDDPQHPALGDMFTRDTGLSARVKDANGNWQPNPATTQQQIAYALDAVRNHGWSDYATTKGKLGYNNWSGVGPAPQNDPGKSPVSSFAPQQQATSSPALAAVLAASGGRSTGAGNNYAMMAQAQALRGSAPGYAMNPYRYGYLMGNPMLSDADKAPIRSMITPQLYNTSFGGQNQNTPAGVMSGSTGMAAARPGQTFTVQTPQGTIQVYMNDYGQLVPAGSGMVPTQDFKPGMSGTPGVPNYPQAAPAPIARPPVATTPPAAATSPAAAAAPSSPAATAPSSPAAATSTPTPTPAPNTPPTILGAGPPHGGLLKPGTFIGDQAQAAMDLAQQARMREKVTDDNVNQTLEAQKELPNVQQYGNTLHSIQNIVENNDIAAGKGATDITAAKSFANMFANMLGKDFSEADKSLPLNEMLLKYSTMAAQRVAGETQAGIPTNFNLELSNLASPNPEISRTAQRHLVDNMVRLNDLNQLFLNYKSNYIQGSEKMGVQPHNNFFNLMDDWNQYIGKDKDNSPNAKILSKYPTNEPPVYTKSDTDHKSPYYKYQSTEPNGYSYRQPNGPNNTFTTPVYQP